MTSTGADLAGHFRDQLRTPLTRVGGFFRMCVLTGKALFRGSFQWREFILQSWFIMRVAILPTMAISVPITALFIFTFNILLIQVGAADLSAIPELVMYSATLDVSAVNALRSSALVTRVEADKTRASAQP